MRHEGRLERKAAVPHVVQTTPRPDVFLWSEDAKKIILIDL